MTTPKTEAITRMLALGETLAATQRDGRNEEPRSIGDILRDAIERHEKGPNMSGDQPNENRQGKSFLDWAMEHHEKYASETQADEDGEQEMLSRVISEAKALTPEQLNAGVMTEAMHGPAAQIMEAKFFIDKMLDNPVSEESIAAARTLVGFCASTLTPLEEAILGQPTRHFGECKRDTALALLRELISLGFHMLINTSADSLDYLMLGVEGNGVTDHTIIRVTLPMNHEQACGLMITSNEDMRPLFGSIFTSDNIE